MKKIVLIGVLLCLLASTVSAFWECEPTVFYTPGTEEYIGVLSERTCYEVVCKETKDSRYTICSDGWVRYPSGYKVIHVDTLLDRLDSRNRAVISNTNQMVSILTD